ncbi:MAG: glycosyltransferase [Nitrospinota bacterium]|nr:glycosyltransferase [Nitrospinota bacterium]
MEKTTALLLCTAPPDAVEKASDLAKTKFGCDNIFFAGSSTSPFSKQNSDKFLSWGDGPFSFAKAITLYPAARKIKPDIVLIPLNNPGGHGYRLLKLFAKLVSKSAVTITPDGDTAEVDEGLFTLLFSPEEKFHAIAISILEIFARPLVCRFNKKTKIPKPAKIVSPTPYKTIVERERGAPQVSIVIRTYNEEKFLGKTLEAVFLQKGVDAEVIVIDSSSTDSTLEIAKSFPARIFTIRKEDFTYGGTLNLGAKLARGEIIVNLSAHAVPAGNRWLSSLIEPLNDGTVAGVHGRELPMEGHAGLFEEKILLDAFGERPLTRSSDPFFSNANSAIPKKFIQEFPFDESLGWAEDQLWASAVQKGGYKTAYAPAAAVYHSHNLNMAGNFDRSLAYYRMLFYTIHKENAAEVASSFRKKLPTRALSFRKFLTIRKDMNPIYALLYAPWCEFVNYLGCREALSEFRRGGLAQTASGGGAV